MKAEELALVQGWAGRHSASIDPDDPESPHFDHGGIGRNGPADGDAREAVAATSPFGDGPDDLDERDHQS